jgi:hypothetical protein
LHDYIIINYVLHVLYFRMYFYNHCNIHIFVNRDKISNDKTIFNKAATKH